MKKLLFLLSAAAMPAVPALADLPPADGTHSKRRPARPDVKHSRGGAAKPAETNVRAGKLAQERAEAARARPPEEARKENKE